MTTTIHDRQTWEPGLVVLEVASLRAGAHVLDVGCGRGDAALAAARRVGPSGLVLGVDTSLTELEEARRRAADARLRHVGFVHGDAETQRFAPLRFDVIVSASGFDAFADPDAVVANLTRALRGGGRLAIGVRSDQAAACTALERAGLVDAVARPGGVVTASAPATVSSGGGDRQPQLASNQRMPVSADGCRRRESARASI